MATWARGAQGALYRRHRRRTLYVTGTFAASKGAESGSPRADALLAPDSVIDAPAPARMLVHEGGDLVQPASSTASTIATTQEQVPDLKDFVHGHHLLRRLHAAFR